MPVKQECGPQFCDACEVPTVCSNPAVLITARVAIRSMLKGHLDVGDQLYDSGFDNEQVVEIFRCLSRNRQGLCAGLIDPEQSKSKQPPHLETC